MTTMNANASFWNQAAEKYAASPVADVPAFERKKAITRSLLNPDATILEIGCGTGTLALELASSAGHIHALDLSSAMIRIANSKRAEQGVTNVTFHEGVLADPLPVKPGQLDGVWAYSILHLVDDRRDTLRRSFELLKPGGSFVSSNVCLKESWIPYSAIIAVMRWFGKAPKVHLYDRETILRELREIGFQDIREQKVSTNRKVAFITATKPA